MSQPRQATDWLDGVAVAASTACLVHCLALPVAIAMIPALSRSIALPESFHIWLLAFVVPFSGLVLWQADRGRARCSAVLLLGLFGLGLLIAGAAVGESLLEAGLTVGGALSLAGAHLLNWRRRVPGRARPS